MKQNWPGHIMSPLYVHKYCQQELCKYRTLEYYLGRTLPVRALEHNALLLFCCYYGCVHNCFKIFVKDGAYEFNGIFAPVYDYAGNVDLGKCY